MRVETVCFLLRWKEVCLALKKRTFGVGLWNGYGGKVEENETPLECVIREILAESGVRLSEEELIKVAIVNVYHGRELKRKVHVFLAHAWEGEPHETEEMGPPQWFRLDDGMLPVSEMFPGDAIWLPLVLSGKAIKADVVFSPEGGKVYSVLWRRATFQ